jgi:hypothetical protein
VQSVERHHRVLGTVNMSANSAQGNGLTSTKSLSPVAASTAKGILPNWSPWAVLMGLMALGAGGALGLVPQPRGLPEANAGSAERAEVPSTGEKGSPAATPQPAGDPSVRPPGVPEVVEVRQIVVQHEKSWKKADGVTRKKEEARRRCEEALAMLGKGVPWDKVMDEYSDNPETKRNHGSMGLLTWDHTSLIVREPVFKLKVNERSPVTESPFGFHIYQRVQ